MDALEYSLRITYKDVLHIMQYQVRLFFLSLNPFSSLESFYLDRIYIWLLLFLVFSGSVTDFETGKVVANFEATADNQLSLHVGELVRIQSKSPAGWWQGEV